MQMSLNQFYRALSISKQSLHQRLSRQLKTGAIEHQLLHLVYQVRENHPTMGCRDMYYLLMPEGIGRDSFERFCRQNGLMSERPKNYRKTTDSYGVTRFDNLTINLTVDRLNQVWVSDITYFELHQKFYYLTFIMDGFSRRILGYCVSRRLFTEHTTLAALEMAIESRKGIDLRGTIFHSDGGGQYYDKSFLECTSKLGLRNSMCEYPWENGKAERINGVIKNNYLNKRIIGSYQELIKEVDRSVSLYNLEKPHKSLKRLSPINFEKKYIADGKTSAGVNSTTENKNCNRRDNYIPSGCGKTSTEAKITPKNDINICSTVR